VLSGRDACEYAKHWRRGRDSGAWWWGEGEPAESLGRSQGIESSRLDGTAESKHNLKRVEAQEIRRECRQRCIVRHVEEAKLSEASEFVRQACELVVCEGELGEGSEGTDLSGQLSEGIVGQIEQLERSQ